MANADAAFGLRPIADASGAPYNGARNIYSVDATSGAAAVYIGDPVKLTGTADSNGIPQVAIANGTTEAMIGVVVGFASDKSGSQLQDDTKYLAGGTNNAGRYALVADDPNLVFAVQEDSTGGALAATDVGSNKYLAIVAGNTTSGVSKTELDSSSSTTSAHGVKVLRLRQTANNAIGTNAEWEVIISNHVRGATAVGV